ncbi:c-type cytochrome [Exilibacterium tricleocarpae]|uniref:C-type cytochrome n=1 Tax=Exilibacterium tricleocarpae TaxID=2591008 RepID=A0A545TZ53_9GAMM|nr:cytochrome c [Exilibacterium tricleocarpae]TQV82499.1 c-type cytochrome [Exilibacterium tricleocarpae]
MKKFSLCVLLPLTLLAAGCDTGPESPRGFSLPVGDAAKGEVVFQEFNCTACHTLKGKEGTSDSDAEVPVVLGGKVTRVKTYAELVTSIINPSHRLAKGYPEEVIQENGQSKMTNFNAIMTVEQLANLVTFLQPHYELEKYEPTYYPSFY